jgi:hypothetical protein
MSDKKKWGVMYITSPTSPGIPTMGPNAGQIVGWVRPNKNGSPCAFDTFKEADSCARRMRMLVYKRGHSARYRVVELPDDNQGGTDGIQLDRPIA